MDINQKGMMNFPHMNPLRFRVKAWGDSFPTKQTTIDQYSIGDTVYNGVYPINFVPIALTFVSWPFQFESDVLIGNLTCTLYKDGVSYSTLTST